MATLSTLRSNIADQIDRTDLNTQIDLSINRAITHYGANKFWFNEAASTFVTVADQKSYGTADGISTAVAGIEVAQVTVNSVNFELYKKTYDFVTLVNTDDFTGYPEYWAYYDEKMYLYPTPDASYTVSISYITKYPTLTADGDSNDFTNNAEDLIESRSRWWLYKRILHDRERALEAKEDEMDAFNNLTSLTNNRINAGGTPLMPTDY